MEELRTIARPYASAVFDIARNKETLSEWSIFLKKSSELLKQEEIRSLIKTPGLNKKTVAEIFFELSVEESETTENKALFSNFLNVFCDSFWPSSKLGRRLRVFRVIMHAHQDNIEIWGGCCAFF